MRVSTMGKKASAFLLPVFVMLSIVLLAGCDKGSSNGGANANGDGGVNLSAFKEPVTLQVFQQQANLSDDEFARYFTEPVKKKFPNVTLELVRSGKGNSAADLVATGTFPDIIFTGDALADSFTKLDLFNDNAGMIEKYKVDLSKFDATAMDTIYKLSDHKGVAALPFSINYTALFYNKDIFNKLGAVYPHDLMTWDETIELAKKVMRFTDGQQYRGLDTGGVLSIGSTLSLPFVDPVTNKPMLETDGWKKALELIKQINDIPGNPPKAGTNNREPFLKDQNLAMISDYGTGMIGMLENMQKDGNPMNWDLTTQPQLPEAPGLSRGMNVHFLAVSKISKQKDAAFQVILQIVSEETQTLMSRDGRLPALSNLELQKNYGSNLESLKGKNVAAIFKLKLAKLAVATEYDDFAKNQLSGASRDVNSGKKDINTALRDAQEAAAKAINEKLQGNK